MAYRMQARGLNAAEPLPAGYSIGDWISANPGTALGIAFVSYLLIFTRAGNFLIPEKSK